MLQFIKSDDCVLYVMTLRDVRVMKICVQSKFVKSTISLTTDGALASGGDFIGVTCLTTFTAGSGPGNSSTPACNITINNDLLVEQDETFSLTAAIQNSNGQSAQFSAGGDSASTTITEIDGQLIMFAVFTFLYNVYREIEIFGFWSTYQIANSMCMNSNDVP